MISNELIRKQKTIPKKPGVYIFFNAKNEAIYVGKAKNLSNRTGSYFNLESLSKRIKKMVSEAVDIKFHITENENDAFFLEAQLIKEKQPIYNILYKNGRSVYYIIFTDHVFPKLEIVSKWQKNAIGPFLSVNLIKTLLIDVQKIFKVRTCSDFVFSKKKRPCLEYYANRCSAPCVNFIELDKYMESISGMKRFFNGQTDKILKLFESEMKKYVKDEKFEDALVKRDQIFLIKKMKESQNIIFENVKRLDVAVSYKNYFYVESIRNGAIFNIEYRKYSKKIDFQDMLLEFYIEEPNYRIIGLQKDVFFKNYSNDLTTLEKKIYQTVSKRMKDLIFEDEEKENWKNILNVEKFESVEVYDCSHYGGKNALCGMIYSNVDNEYIKSNYRVWKMEKNTQNDLEILETALLRRAKNGNFADVVLIDGGLTQLNVAKKALFPFKNIFAFAKGENRKGGIVYNYDGQKVEINDKKLFFFFENLRDEAHRWAKKNATLRFGKKYEGA